MYKMFISSPDNSWISFIPFLGVSVSSKEDIIKTLKTYGTYQKEDKRYWRELIKISFWNESTSKTIKNDGDQQCVDNNCVDLFKLASIARKDNLNDYTVFFRKGQWIDNEGKTFSWCVLDKQDNVTPIYGKLIDVLHFIGIDI